MEGPTLDIATICVMSDLLKRFTGEASLDVHVVMPHRTEGDAVLDGVTLSFCGKFAEASEHRPSFPH